MTLDQYLFTVAAMSGRGIREIAAMSFPQIKALEAACIRVRAMDRLGEYTLTGMAIGASLSKEGGNAARAWVRDMQKLAGTD